MQGHRERLRPAVVRWGCLLSECRSSVYCTDLAKVTESPVFHVNADDPVSVVHAVEMAVQIRDLFGIDVYVDILGSNIYLKNK